MNPVIFKAILSMDSYNRGYGSGIELNDNDIGNATIAETTIDGIIVNLDSIIIRNTNNQERLDDNIGFYAIAYDTDGDNQADVISYRGTDDFDGFGDLLSSLDVQYGRQFRDVVAFLPNIMVREGRLCVIRCCP
jgi:hypothetical protein